MSSLAVNPCLVRSGEKRDRFLLYLPHFVSASNPAPKRRKCGEPDETTRDGSEHTTCSDAVRVGFRLMDEDATAPNERGIGEASSVKRPTESSAAPSPTVGVEESFVVVRGQGTSDMARRSSSMAFASAVRKTAINLMQTGKVDLAFRYLGLMQKFIQTHSGEDDSNIYVASLQRIHGLVHEHRGDLGGAVECWYTALIEEQGAVAIDSECALLDLQKIASLYLRLGDAESALEFLHERASYLRKAVAGGASAGGAEDRSANVKTLGALAVTFKTEADAYLFLGETNEALSALTKSAQLYKECGREWTDLATFSTVSMERYVLCNSHPNAASCA